MPIERELCDECCKTTIRACPECGSRHVTPREKYSPDTMTPTDVVDFGVDEDGDTELTYVHVCWDCGWKERVTVTIQRERVD
jgi:hypothetical protein